jgi:protein-L-isoaspartate O-methyltransferase
MVLPIGAPDSEQQLVLVQKGPSGDIEKRNVLPVQFAPLVVAH